jgi:DNA-binding transcriptional LysR family regulator
MGGAIQRFDVERSTLLQMIAQGFGVSIAAQATALVDIPGLVFLQLRDEPEQIPFSAIWSPYNRSAALLNLLDLAGKLGQLIRAV